MIRATGYIVACTTRNKVVRRLRRLRERRYLTGALVGALYLAFTLFMRQRAYQDAAGGGSAGSLLPALGAFGIAATASLLACATAVAWILPFRSGLLEFSRAETEFLFPAPVARRQLVIYRVLRSQAAVLIGALIVALAYPTGSLVARFRGLLGVWIVLMASSIFFSVVTMARESFRGGARSAFAWLAALFSAVNLAALAAGLTRELNRGPLATVDDVVRVVLGTMEGAAGWALAPVVWLVQPLFADGAWDFLVVLVRAVVVCIVAVGWLLWADAASPEANDAEEVRREVRPDGRRPRAYVTRSPAWTLAASGRPEWVFAWKGALQMFRSIDRRALLRGAIVLTALLVATLVITRARGVVLLVGVFATWGALFSIFLAPQVIRLDLREDLAHLAMLKTWPIRGQAVLRGEIIWPSVVVTVMAWLFGLLSMVMSLASLSRIPLGNRGSFWVAFLIAIPGMVLAQYTMHNGFAVLFPGWTPIGPTRARGVAAVGQHLIVLVATWIGLAVAVLPGVLATSLLFTIFGRAARMWVLPVGALTITLTVVVEMLLVTRALGATFERLDLATVEPPD